MFPIGDFTDDAGPLLESLLTTCIETANQELPPIANAGPDQSVVEAEVVTLDATGSALGYIDTVAGFNSVWADNSQKGEIVDPGSFEEIYAFIFRD